MRFAALLPLAAFLAGCVSTTTRLAPVAPEAVEAEEARQRELVVSELNAEQQRLDDLAFGLLAAATPLCQGRTTERIGVSCGTAAPTGTSGRWLPARPSEVVQARVAPVVVCDFSPVVIAEGDINAFADGERVIFPWAMMRFAEDDELLGVLGHEIAHNAMGHIEARRTNALWGGLLGAFFDVALATQGVNSHGQNTSSFMAAAARACSQDFEREADYVGMYILARASVPLESVPDFWRRFAQINPSAISYASTHPTTAERFVRLRQAIEEIEAKREAGEELMPEMREAMR